MSDFEGIEEEQQRTFLMECGFNYGRGYYFDRPLPLEEFEKKSISDRGQTEHDEK